MGRPKKTKRTKRRKPRRESLRARHDLVSDVLEYVFDDARPKEAYELCQHLAVFVAETMGVLELSNLAVEDDHEALGPIRAIERLFSAVRAHSENTEQPFEDVCAALVAQLGPKATPVDMRN